MFFVSAGRLFVILIKTRLVVRSYFKDTVSLLIHKLGLIRMYMMEGAFCVLLPFSGMDVYGG